MNFSSRSLKQPGTPDPVRIESIAGDALAHTFELQAGINLRDALASPLRAAGLSTATVRLDGVTLGSLHYVRPAPPPDDTHVAYYSEPHAIDAPVRIEFGCATLGHRDGAPFVHCHAVWRTPNGRRQGGHLFADQVVVRNASSVHAFGVANVDMAAEFDPETGFTLFHPVDPAGASPAPLALEQEAAPEPAPRARRRGVVARIRPNEDLLEGIEKACVRHGIRAATIHGSVGSIIGARFDDAEPVDDIFTEILVLDGAVHDGPDGPRASLEVAVIDPRGGVRRGRLARGDNPVLICFELYLDER